MVKAHNMQTYLGILGDPAKLGEYDEQFYSLLQSDETGTAFHLIGASERDVTKKEYQMMYNNFEASLGNLSFRPLPQLNNSDLTTFRSRIGLFPSSASHLIRGPNFTFAPFPINSKSRYLKFKSRFLNAILSPFLRSNILNLAYLPLGGKAAMRTKADHHLGMTEIGKLFYRARSNDWFDLFYLEAGSGQSSLSTSTIDHVLKKQAAAILGQELSQIEEITQEEPSNIRFCVPGAIYGGGIRSISQIDELLSANKSNLLIPEFIIVGNISEEDISQTYKILDRVAELNNLETRSVSHIGL